MLMRLAVAALLLAHAAIHVAFIAPPPPATAGGPAWPFATSQSWLLTRLGFARDELRFLALGLVAVTIAAFALGALVAVGIAPTELWMPAIGIGALASLALLIPFFHPWLVLGVVIDVVLLWASVIAGWMPATVESGV